MKRTERLKVLERLKSARSAGAKRIEQYEVEETGNNVFEDITEEEYQRRVETNKKNKFIVDDSGLGYDDHGEEEFQDDSEQEEITPTKKPKQDTKSIKSFLKPANFAAKPKLTPKPKVTSEASISLMKNLLGNIDLGDDDDEEEEDPRPESMDVETSAPILIAEKAKAMEEARKRQLATEPPVRMPERPAEPSNSTPGSRKRIAPGTNPPVSTEVKPNNTSEDSTAAVQHDSPPTSTTKEGPTDTEMKGEESAKAEPMEHFHADTSRTTITNLEDLQVNAEGQLLMYWIDAHEDREVSPGSVLLFGKVWIQARNRFESICVTVKDVPRVQFVLPRDQEELGSLHSELEELRRKMKIPEIRCKVVKKNYAFELPDVPLEPVGYLKVMYGGKFQPFSQASGVYYSHVFGARNSLVENLLIKRRMKGPCWLRLQSPQAKRGNSYCMYEVAVENYKCVVVNKEDVNLPAPPLIVLSLYVQTYRNDKNLTEVAAIGGIINSEIIQDGPTVRYESRNQSFALIRKLYTLPDNLDRVTRPQHAEVEQSEKALLNNLMAKLQLIDPDIVIGHDLYSLLDLLIVRMGVCGCSGASKMGRLNRARLPTGKFKEEYYQGQNWIQRIATCGRLLIDTFSCTKELVKEATYTLQHLAEARLEREFREIERENLPAMYLTANDLILLARHIVTAALIPLDLVMKLSMIPLSKQLTNTAGNLWIRSLQQARAERNEMLLLHEFHRRNYVCPDRAVLRDKTEFGKKKRANAYTGGLVLEPKSGLYDKYVLLLDFNSLYPSIIQEFNICFTTVVRPRSVPPEEESKGEQVGTVPGKDDSPPGILPAVIKSLVDRRRAVKESLKREKDPLRLEQLEIKQRALKLTANSMYGCLGFKNSRFYAMPIAALITQQGRITLEKAVRIVREELHLDVIYGDTDSIMINTNMDSLDQAMKLGREVKQRINKEFRCLEIEIDGVFQSILLYKKKKYAAIKLEGERTIKEVKGLDLVRRDWCPLTKQISHQVLDVILSGRPREDIVSGIHETLEKFNAQLQNNKFPLGSYIITKQLTKQVSQYADIKSQPHVMVAKRMMEQGQQNILNHFIPYIICKGENQSVGERAYSVQEVQSSNGALEPDLSWYINQQVLPPTLRLCGVIAGTDCGRLASIFGQDPSKYQSFDEQRNEEVVDMPQQPIPTGIPDIIVRCCEGHENKFIGSMISIGNGEFKSGFSCSDCSSPISWKSIKNAMTRILRDITFQFYQGWAKCEEPLCPTRLRQTTLKRCPTKGCKKQLCQEMTAAKLHAVFYRLQELTNCGRERLGLPKDDREDLDKLQVTVTQAFISDLLKQSLYEQVSLKDYRIAEVDTSGVLP